MLTVEEIKSFIDADAASVKKDLAKVGVRYYEGDHDIKNYRMFFVDSNGDVKEDKFKSNIKISHPFFTENVDQTVQYVLSNKDGFLKSDIPELQTELDVYFNDNEDFDSEIADVLTGGLVKGFEYAYAYKNADDRTAFQCADSIGVVEVEARFASDKQDHILYWYVDRIDKDGKKIKRIQVWDSMETHFYRQEDDGKIEPDPLEPINPKPHTIYKKGTDGTTYYESFGFIPFVRFDTCKKQHSTLNPIKALIDDYDLMSCGLSNNIQDSNEVLYVVKGFEGDNLDELHFNTKTKKLIGVGDDGDVEIRTIDIPYEARKTKLELDEMNIYRFGMALNTSGLKDTNATTNLAIKAAYSLLDLKANKIEKRLKQFIRKLLKIVLDEINERNGTEYTQGDVYFAFDREIPTNEQENAQIELTDAQRKQTEITTLLNIATHIDNETLMQLICEQLDIDYEDIKDKLPVQEENTPYTAQSAIDAIVPEAEPEVGGGDVIE
jgi:SPP1 family phage portal protein